MVGLKHFRELAMGAGFVVLLILLFVVHNPHHSNNIVDISWPNCAVAKTNTYSEGIVGVTGGLDFRPNPCLAGEASIFSKYALYMNTGYPGRSYGLRFRSSPIRCVSTNDRCLAFNWGYNAAEYAIRYSYVQVAHSNEWWIDVETDNSWTDNTGVNRSSIEGAIAATKQIPFVRTIGIYSTPDQWFLITNYWQNGLPEWIGTGSLSKSIARQDCYSLSFTGGPVKLSQYTQNLDVDLSCN
jgi:hypothetical protein